MASAKRPSSMRWSASFTLASQNLSMARERKDHAWFIAFAPVSSPEIAVAVLAEHAGEHGGTAAAPIAQQVIAHYFGVADDDDATIRQTARVPF